MALNHHNRIFLFFHIYCLFNITINADNECEKGWTYFNLTQMCYNVLQNLTFTMAKKQCSLQNSGSLVSIHNNEENEFVNKLVENTVKWDFNSDIILTALIGLHDPEFNRIWRWTDGSIVDYTYWNIGEPNNEFGEEFCVETIIRLDHPNPSNPIIAHSWNDNSCSSITPAAVCKYKPGNKNLYYFIIIIIAIIATISFIIAMILLKVRQRRQLFPPYRILSNRTTIPDIEYHLNTVTTNEIAL